MRMPKARDSCATTRAVVNNATNGDPDCIELCPDITGAFVQLSLILTGHARIKENRICFCQSGEYQSAREQRVFD